MRAIGDTLCLLYGVICLGFAVMNMNVDAEVMIHGITYEGRDAFVVFCCFTAEETQENT